MDQPSDATPQTHLLLLRRRNYERAADAPTEGDTACAEEDTESVVGVKPDLGTLKSLTRQSMQQLNPQTASEWRFVKRCASPASSRLSCRRVRGHHLTGAYASSVSRLGVVP